MFRWKRTNFEGFPRVYLRFKAKDFDSDELVEYRIQDLPEEKFKDAINFYTGDQFLRDEQFTKGTEVKDDPEALEELKEFAEVILNEKIALACFKEGSNEIIALNVLYVLAHDEHDIELPLKNQKLRKLFEIARFISKKCETLQPQGVEFVLEGMGLSVSKDYRKRGVATKMLEGRIPLMKSVGLTTTSTIFTGKGSQTAAKKAGYTEYFEITYDELAANGYTFKHLTEHSVKTMGYQLKN